MSEPADSRPLATHAASAFVAVWFTWAAEAVTMVRFASQPRPLPSSGFPVLPTLLALLWLVYVVTGVRARFRLGRDEPAQNLRRLSGMLMFLMLVVIAPRVFSAASRAGEAGFYDLCRASLPTVAGIGYACALTVLAVLFAWETAVASAEVRGANTRRAGITAGLALAVGLFLSLSGLSFFAVGRAFWLGS